MKARWVGLEDGVVLEEDGWKQFPGCPYYEVHRQGYVRASVVNRRAGVQPGKIVARHWTGTRFNVRIKDGPKNAEIRLADIVGRTFLGAAPSENHHAAFLNENPMDCSLRNLVWSDEGEGPPMFLLNNGEIVRPVAGYEGYHATSHGRIWSETRKRFIKPTILEGKQPFVHVYRNGKMTNRMLAKLIMEVFADLFPPKAHSNMMAGRRDGDVLNCSVDNLIWESQTSKARGRRVRTLSAKPIVKILAPAPRLIIGLLHNNGNVLPSQDEMRKERYYCDAQFNVLCGACATNRVISQSENLEAVDETFPFEFHVIHPIHSVRCSSCEAEVKGVLAGDETSAGI